MPFSKAPVTSTYETKHVPFVTTSHQRSGALPDKDSRLVNMLVEVLDAPTPSNPGAKKVFVKSRAGVSTAYTNTAGVGRGTYYWLLNGTSYIFTVIAANVYVNGVLNQTLTTSTGECGFTEYINDVGTKQLVLLDGTKGYIWSNPAIAPTQITDANFPTPHVPMPCFLDGYLCVAKANTADVYNSNLNDPFTWTAGDFMSAEMYPDIIVGLVRNNNYINAIGTNSVEFLYDAANATGSPLGRHDGVVLQFGCATAGTIVGTEKEVIFVGETGNGGHTVWLIDGYKPDEIGTPAIKGVLLTEGSSLASATAHCIRVSGQKVYILCLTTRTLVYSFDSKVWTEFDSGATGGSTFFGGHSTDGPNGTAYILGKSSGKTYQIGEAYLDDDGTNFQCQIVTDKFNFDVMDNKFASRLSIVGDIPDSTNVDNGISVEWSDDDYKTWSTPRTLDMGAEQPAIRQMGKFRRRAFRFKYAKPHLLRLDEFELDINKGSQ